MELQLIRYLVEHDIRIFTTEEARGYAQEVGLNPDAIIDRLHRLNKKGIINRLIKGLYALAPEFLRGIPIHEYEIATALTKPSCIAYISAFGYHNLTDQISSLFYVLAPEHAEQTRSYSTYSIRGITYRIIRTKQVHYFGCEQRWIGQIQVPITDLERTLIDGIIKPKYCGGMREVLHGYTEAIDRIDIDKIISYAEKISIAACKRLGWILSYLGVKDKQLRPLLDKKATSYTKLDASGPSKGKWNKKWLLQENL